MIDNGISRVFDIWNASFKIFPPLLEDKIIFGNNHEM